MANETQKLKFTSLDEAKEFLLQSKEQNTDVSQKQFLDAVSALNLDDDTMDDLYNWIDENMIEFIDGDELDQRMYFTRPNWSNQQWDQECSRSIDQN